MNILFVCGGTGGHINPALAVANYIKEHRRFSFRNLLEKQHSKMEIVITFLAILEMMKMGNIQIEQDGTFGEILITSNLAA